jgi:hypothetical protein
MLQETSRTRKLRKIRALEQGTSFGGEAAAARARVAAITGEPLSRVSLRTALDDPQLLGNAISGDSWKAWRALLLASRGEPLEDDELALFQRLTERQDPPVERVQEFYCVIGRRGGKSRAIASLLTYLATMVDYRGKLASGEIPVVLCLSPSQEQSGIILSYVKGIMRDSPVLAQLIVRETAEQIELSNRVTINVRAASFRRLRGQTCVAAVFDEIAFFMSDESSNPDTEILAAVKPSLATTGGPLIAISSPHRRKGVLWEAFKAHFGAKGNPRILVAKGASRELNPCLTEEFVNRELEKDPAFGAAEYLAEFRTDLETFISNEALDACTDGGVKERAYERGRTYSCFVDPSGGAHDSFAMAISHKEGQTAVLDLIWERRPPFAPESCVEEICSVLRRYQIISCRGDRYAGEWNVEAFRRRGVTYEPAEKTKSELYSECLPMINSRTVALLDDPALRHQFACLERRTRMGGRGDVIDHARGGRDDIANAAAGALVYAGQSLGDMRFWQAIPYPKDVKTWV